MMIKMNEESQRALAMLRYQEKHYRTMGQGSKSQALSARIRQMMDKIKKDAVKN